MFRFEGAGIRVGGRELFKNLNWQVGSTDRVGLVGANGAGKTTLLKALCGLQELDRGYVHSGRMTTFGYLPQEGILRSENTVFGEARSVFAELLHIKARQENLLQELQQIPHEDPGFDTMLERIQQLEDQFRNGNGYRIDSDVGFVLKGLGFEKEDWERPVNSFSGGWQMRLALAKLLLQKPNLLLLDEPTNHLDLEAREWLAGYLGAYPHAIVLVAHDRYFLDKVVSRITEIEHGVLTDYPGNYSHFLKDKESRRAAQWTAYKQQQDEITRIEAFIERFRYKASKAAQVQSRVKVLEKMERLPLPAPRVKSVKFRFPEPPRSGEIVLELIDIKKSYGDNSVLNGIDLSIHRNDKVALAGPNGAGKSTLMRILAGCESTETGIRRLGHNVLVSYFAQDQARTLSQSLSVLDELGTTAPQLSENELRSLLGSFLFTGSDVEKRVAVLSGGEKNRLALCKLLTRPGNLLLLDEPTNHLDITSKEILLEALGCYSGTIVFVSHDRFFLERLAGRVVEVGQGSVYNYPGNYRDFLAHKQAKEAAEKSAAEAQTTSITPTEDPTATELSLSSGAQAYKERKRTAREFNRVKNRIDAVQEEISSKESTIAQLSSEMNDPKVAREYAMLLKLEEQRIETIKEVEDLYAEWEGLSEKLEVLL